MTRSTDNSGEYPDRILPMAVLGLAAWHALPTLIEAWGSDLYSAGAPLAFGLWLASQGWLYFKQRQLAGPPCMVLLVLSLLLCAAGSMCGLRVLHHLALATAVSALPGWKLGACITTSAAMAWLPATGWFLSHWKSGGLAGWERPAFAGLMALLLVGLSRISGPPSHTPPPAT
jgi:hypothetical protein